MRFRYPLLALFSTVCCLSVPIDPRCSDAESTLLKCVNATAFVRTRCSDSKSTGAVEQCRAGFRCIADSCVSDDLRVHLQRAVDYQIVESVPASEVSQCRTDPLEDARAGRMLCEVLHGTLALQPTFALELGNTWATFSPGGSRDNCTWYTPAEWRACYGINIARQAAAAQSRSPHLVVSAGLMEFLDKANLDDPSLFPERCCVKGSVGQWGGKSTCVPDVQTACAQDYYVAMGQMFMDAGCRAFSFGQARLTGGGRPGLDSRVSKDGAAGFAAVITRLRAHAASKGFGPTWYGPQAAAGFELANGTDVADWVYGAQHLFARQAWLVQPFGRNGTAPSHGEQWYGSGDYHDVNRVNNANGIPVLLDFDNFSGEEAVPDDIRRLSAWPNATRAKLLVNLWRTLRFYNPRAVLSVPLAKAAGGAWGGFHQPQSECFSHGRDGLYFGGTSCGLIEAAKFLFAQEPYSSDPIADGVEPYFFGEALQDPDLTAVWMFQSLLMRDFASVQEYSHAVESLPGLILGARGARCRFATTILQSAEFKQSSCATAWSCVAARLTRTLCLGVPACIATGNVTAGAVMEPVAAAQRLCNAADSVGLFGNAALIDPGWGL